MSKPKKSSKSKSVSIIPPTDKEINEEIARLKEMKPKIVNRNFFGESNHDKIDAQISALTMLMDEDDIRKEFLHNSAYEDEDGEPTDEAFRLEEAAREAVQWMEGTVSERPSKDWESLVREKGK